MHNLGDIISTVQHNCDISDARHAGNYTMCIFLLKMRELYRWENQIPLTEPMPRSEIGDWLVERENTWNRIEENDYAPLQLGEPALDPFEAESINSKLAPYNMVYSSGYGLHQKPHFFIGALESVDRRRDLTIYISSCEYARDLVAPPAMMRGNTVFIRQESLRRYLWERIEGWQLNKSNRDTPMGRALDQYGYQRADIDAVLDRMTRDETEAVILHEIGEAMAGDELGSAWEQMLATYPSTKLEFMARAARDLLADCVSTLPALIDNDNDPSLHFYFANLNGMRKHLYPQLHDAYEQWMHGRNQDVLKDAVKRGGEHWRQQCQTVVSLFNQYGDRACDPITDFLEPVELQ